MSKEVYPLENIEELWQYILNEMKSKISKPSYDTWLSQTAVKNISEQVLIISVPNEFTKNWLDQRYTEIIDTLLYEMTGIELSVKFEITEENAEPEEPKVSQQKKAPTKMIKNKSD